MVNIEQIRIAVHYTDKLIEHYIGHLLLFEIPDDEWRLKVLIWERERIASEWPDFLLAMPHLRHPEKFLAGEPMLDEAQANWKEEGF